MSATSPTSPTVRGVIRPSRGERSLESVLAQQLVLRVHGLLRSLRLYDVSNHAVQSHLEQLLETLAVIAEDEVALVTSGEHFYLNGARIKAEPSQLAHFRALAADLTARGLGGLQILSALSREELESFLRLFAPVASAEHVERLQRACADERIGNIAVILASDVAPAEEPGAAHDAAGVHDERARARTTFWHSVAGSKSVLQSTARTGKPAMNLARRVVQPLVDTLMKEEYSILGLTALKNHDEYTYAHCVNVSLLSIAIGRRLGLPRTALASLGVSALLHDIGKLAVPAEVLQKAGKLSHDEWGLVQRHPIEGVRLVARHPGFTPQVIDAMRVCLQHHQTYDGKGYPRFTRECRQSTLVRIVAAADCYDAMTGHRAYRNRPMSGFEALQQLVGREAASFDPAVLWALVTCVGLYPSGSVMITSSGQTVLSMSPNPSDPRRPLCHVIKNADGSRVGPSAAIACDALSAGTTVARVLSPDEIDVDVAALLAS